MLTSVKRMIPRAESPSKVLFHSSHPSVHVVFIVRVVFKFKIHVQFMEIHVYKYPWSKNILLNFELNF